MESPDLYLLREIDWHLYCTLTLDPSNVKKPFSVLASIVRTWHAKVSRESGHAQRYICPFFAPQEDGEMNSRPHFHSCIANIANKKWQNIGFHETIARMWPLGIAEIREYIPAEDGIGYITPASWHAGANAFEIKKMCDDMNRVCTNENFWKELAKVRGVPFIRRNERPQRDRFSRPIGGGGSLAHPHASYIVKV